MSRVGFGVNRHARPQRLCIETLESRTLLAGGPIISEFMASNQGGLADGDGGTPDWIELFNSGNTNVDLAGYRLTDSPQDLSRWTFPPTVLASGEYLIVFASGQNTADYVDAGGYLHTNFQLNRAGEYLALVSPEGEVVSAYSAAAGTFPEQRPSISFGIAQPVPSNGGEPVKIGYQRTATPGAQNGSASDVMSGLVTDTQFSVERGFYDMPQLVEITTATPGATIVYTIDGSTPTAENGLRVPAENDQARPIARVAVTTTATLRAAALKDDYFASTVVTHTYLYVNDVLSQNNSPSGYPTDWKDNLRTAPADYEMDPEITQHPSYRDIIDDALLSIPSISIVTDVDNLFDADTGIYMNPEQRGVAWERPASVELIFPDGREGFHENAGLRIQGGASRMLRNSPKHSFRLLFKSEYGAGRLEYPLFGPTAVADFDTFILRAGFNQSWIHNNEFNGDNRGRAQYVRDQWAKETQRAMGHVAPHTTYAHLYINGLYWGLYNPTERPSAPFAASYLGGDEDDYDVINSGDLVDGNLLAWNQMFALAESGLSGAAEYQAMSELLDIDAFIDYMIINQYGGNLDWDSHNWYAFRRRDPAGKFYWIAWDSEFFFINDGDDVLAADQGPGGKGPGRLFLKLSENAEFRDRFADRITMHFFGDGALTPEKVMERWNALSDVVVDAVIAESARWGDYRRDVDRGVPPLMLYERDVHWRAERDRLLNDYFPNRGRIVLNQFIKAGLYSEISVPLFSQDGGEIVRGSEISINVPSGTIYYTLDGSDPRTAEGTAESTVLIGAGASARAHVPVDDGLALDWTLPAFDDSAWKAGVTGVGYEQRTGYENLISLDVGDEMYDRNPGVYVRVPFELNDPTTLDQVLLNIKYDDGFVAYLNGVEVVRRNSPLEVAWNSAAETGRSDQLAREFESLNVSAFLHVLRPGANLLAIHGLNSRVRDDDFLIVPELLGGVVTDVGAAESARRYSGPITVAQNMVIKARVSLGGEWSSMNIAEFRIVDEINALRVAEIMYHPADPSAAEIAAGFVDANEFEYLEFVNVGETALDLTDIELIEGVTFAFRSGSVQQLAPGQRVLVVENLRAFRFRYGDQPLVAGQWTGQLDNAGEAISIAHSGSLLQQFVYDDAWFPSTDGDGPSLEVIDAAGLPLSAWSLKSSWQASRGQGSPGQPDSMPGDANRDGVFDSRDLVLVFQVGEYEDDLVGNSTWEEGDWNGDGEFTTADLVFAFQWGEYVRAASRR